MAALLVVPALAAPALPAGAAVPPGAGVTASSAGVTASSAVVTASGGRPPADRPNTLAAARRAAATSRNAWVGDRLSTARDKDWFRFVIPRGTWTKLTLGALPADYRLSLFDSAGRRLAVSDRRGTVYEEVSRGLAAGTYFVLVDSTGARDARRPYRLQLRSFRPGLSVQSLRRTPAAVTLVGELFNNTAQWRAVATMRVAFVDRRGRVLGTSPEAYIPGQRVAPRETVGFILMLAPDEFPRGTTGFRVTPINAALPRPPAHRLSVRVTRRTVQASGRTHWFAAANAGQRVEEAHVTVREYDDLGVLTRLAFETVSVPARGTARGSVQTWPLLARPARTVVGVRPAYWLD